jgi:hypothetical protein
MEEVNFLKMEKEANNLFLKGNYKRAFEIYMKLFEITNDPDHLDNAYGCTVLLGDEKLVENVKKLGVANKYYDPVALKLSLSI